MEMIIMLVIFSIIKSIIESNKAKEQSKELGDAQGEKMTLEGYIESLLTKGEDALNQTLEEEKQLPSIPSKAQELPPKVETKASYKPKSKEKTKPILESQEGLGKRPPIIESRQQTKRKEMVTSQAKKSEHTAPKPVVATISPIKTIFENQTPCEHRIELNSNIHKKPQLAVTKDLLTVDVGSQQILQGIIWSEILGEPKAYKKRKIY